MNGTDTVAQQAQSAHAGVACCNQGAKKSLNGLRSRRMLAIAVITAALGTGVVLNWGWLVAAGIAPLVLSVLPCLVMCAVGLCASKLFGGSAKAKDDGGEPPAPKYRNEQEG